MVILLPCGRGMVWTFRCDLLCAQEVLSFIIMQKNTMIINTDVMINTIALGLRIRTLTASISDIMTSEYPPLIASRCPSQQHNSVI